MSVASTVAFSIILCVFGGAVTLMFTSVRDEVSDRGDVAQLRAEFSSLVSVRERIEAGDSISASVVGDQMAAVRGALIRDRALLGRLDSDLGPKIERAIGHYADALAALVEDRGAHAIPEAEATVLDGLAETADDALVTAGDRFENEGERDFRAGLLMIWVVTVGAIVVGTTAIVWASRAARRLRAVEAERRADDRVRALIEHAPDGVAIISQGGSRLSYASPAVARILGHPREELERLDIRTLIHPDDVGTMTRAYRRVVGAQERGGESGSHERLDVRMRHADLSWHHIEMTLTDRTDDPDIAGVVVNGRDITQRVDLERSLSHQAHHDQLTGLANRASFVEQVHKVLDGPDRAPQVSIVFLDLDGFKEINDSLGHGAGDEVLMTIAARLITLTRHRDRAARLGGDEFAVLLVGDDPHPVAERLLAVVGQPVELSTGLVQVGGSVGIATADDVSSVEDLLRCADVAMYDAKARGKNRISQFEPQMHDALIERLAMRSALDEALLHEEFRLVYQPEISLSDGALLGFEALIRWDRADGTVVPPNDFIPVAEANGQIIEIGRWVLRSALDQLVAWQGEFADPRLTMAVNVSARQLDEDEFVGLVARELERTGIAPDTLTLELTETTLIRDLSLTGARLTRLRELGVRIAVDDYGSGHASIGYLREFPIDIVKIDRSFVWALDNDPREAEAYLRSITDLARALAIDTIAEGIEHSSQLERLRALGCGVGQGYHLARPLDVVAATAFLAGRAGDHLRPTAG